MAYLMKFAHVSEKHYFAQNTFFDPYVCLHYCVHMWDIGFQQEMLKHLEWIFNMLY